MKKRLKMSATRMKHFKVRHLKKNDFNNGFVDLLRHLTDVGDVTKEMFERTFDHRISKNKTILVIEDTRSGTIVGTASLLTEYKFTNGCGSHGHIEDVVVNDN